MADNVIEIVLSVIDKATAPIDALRDKLGELVASPLGTLGIGLGIGEAVRGIIDASTQAELAVVKLDRAFQNMGDGVGISKQAMEEWAQTIDMQGLFSTADAEKAQAALLNYANVTGDTFKNVRDLAVNFAAETGGSLEQAMNMFGRAFDRPELGMRLFRQAHISLSVEQQNLVKEMVKTGDVLGAQGVLFDAANKRYEGMADTIRNTLGGAITAFRNALETLGETGQTSTSDITQGLNLLTDRLKDPEVKAAIQALGGELLKDLAALADWLTVAVEGWQNLAHWAAAAWDSIKNIGDWFSSSPLGQQAALAAKIAELQAGQEAKGLKAGDAEYDYQQTLITNMREQLDNMQSLVNGALIKGQISDLRLGAQQIPSLALGAGGIGTAQDPGGGAIQFGPSATTSDSAIQQYMLGLSGSVGAARKPTGGVVNADAEAKKILDAQLAMLKEQQALMNEVLNAGNQQIDDDYQKSLIDLNTYADEKTGLLDGVYRETKAIYDKEIALTEGYIESASTAAAKQEETQKLKQLQAESAKYDIQNEAEHNKLLADESAKSSELAKQILSVAQAYATLTGDTEAAAMIQFDQTHAQDVARFTIQGLTADQAKLNALREDARLHASNDPYDVAKASLADYAKTIQTTGPMIKKSTDDMFKGMEDALVQFATTGKLSFKSLIDSMIADLARLMAQQLIMKDFTSWFGDLLGSVGGSSAGGIVGDVMAFASTAAGGGDKQGLTLVGENGPEIADFGSGGHVYNQAQVAAMGGGGGDITYAPVNNITVTGAQTVTPDVLMATLAQQSKIQQAQFLRTMRDNGFGRLR